MSAEFFLTFKMLLIIYNTFDKSDKLHNFDFKNTNLSKRKFFFGLEFPVNENIEINH